MTYIEFFDETASENVSACLTYAPDRVIYIGDKAKLINKHIDNYKKVFAERGYNIEFQVEPFFTYNIDDAVKLLTRLVETYDDCVFDITGGEEILILALGMVCSQHPKKNIQIHKLNLKNNMIYDCDKDGTTIYRDIPTLSIEENVKIYGGEVVYGGIDEEKTYKWNLDADFLNDIDLIWNICKGNVRFWNMQIGIFEAVNAIGALSEDGLTVTASRAALEHYLLQHKAKYKKAKGIINYLLRHGLLTYFADEDEKTVTVAFKNTQVKKCLTKAGQALEMKVYVTALSVADKNGKPVYDDVLNGVTIDWDGEFHDEKTEGVYDTENEIDIMMMRDTVPIFVSCKNGIVTAEELYKLDTVAKRFGGPYAKKVLVATSIDCLKEAGKYFRQRATDMNIQLIENIQDLDDAVLARKIKTLWNRNN